MGVNILKIYREEGKWTVHEVRDKLSDQDLVYDICRDSVPLIAVVSAMQEFYPKWRVFLSDRISDNPFLQRSIFTMQHYNLNPSYQDVQAMLDRPTVKICNLCQSEAWYNAGVHNWQCINRKCGAHESFIDRGRFFKIRRRR